VQTCRIECKLGLNTQKHKQACCRIKKAVKNGLKIIGLNELLTLFTANGLGATKKQNRHHALFAAQLKD
jgi:hypothetical protein